MTLTEGLVELLGMRAAGCRSCSERAERAARKGYEVAMRAVRGRGSAGCGDCTVITKSRLVGLR